MGKRGPKPKPTSLRVFEGDPGRLLKNRQGEPLPASGVIVPTAPDWLGERGKLVWDYVAPRLHSIGCLSEVDERLLSLYCEAWDEFFAAREEIARRGMVAVGDSGAEYQHPAVGIKNRAIQRIKTLGAEFGMSPASRVGLKAGGASKGGGLAAFKKNG